MKRIIVLLTIIGLALPAVADEMDDHVLEEARARAAGRTEQGTGSVAPGETMDEQEEEQVRHDPGEAERKTIKQEDDAIYLPLALSILPGSPIPGKKVDTTLGVGLIISSLNTIYGAQGSFVGSIAESDVYGFQGAFVFNVSEASVHGAQAAYVFNTCAGPLYGAQLSYVFNVSGGGGPLQSSAVFNVSNGSFSGVQLGGVFNVVNGTMNGVQASAILNVADNLNGMQIGLINVADSAIGLQLGLINIVKDGINDLGIWYDQSEHSYAFLQKGRKHLYSILYAGAPAEDWFETSDNLSVGAGLGLRAGGRQKWETALDLDVSAKGSLDLDALHTAIENESEYIPDLFPSIRASLRLPIGMSLAIHGGVILETEWENGPKVDDYFRTSDPLNYEIMKTDITFYPKWFIGISL